MGFKVCAERCDHCLFGREPLVSDARRRQILNELQRRDTHFVCHKFGVGGSADEDRIDGQDVCCRGDYDRNPARTNLMRIAGRLGAIEFVEIPS